MARTGRRPGDSGSRAAILDAARTRFADQGYDGASIRAIAADAAVDPALVHHYYGSKDQLFAAAMAVPVDPHALVARLLGGGLDDLGERLVRTALGVYGNPVTGRPLLAVVRSGITNERAGRMLRQFVSREVLGPVARAVGTDQPELRASLCGSQIIGMVLARYVVRIEPLASATDDQVAAWVGPTLQRYLTAPHPGAEPH